jgi:hypothetical protein
MDTVTALLREIDAFLAGAGIAESTFGRKAVNDGKFVGRLREGSGITVATVDRVRAYIAAESAATKRKRDAAKPESAAA